MTESLEPSALLASGLERLSVPESGRVQAVLENTSTSWSDGIRGSGW
jgi:hypothetical protein